MEKYALMAAAFGALAITAASGLLIIPALRRLHFGQTIKEIGPTWHQGKNGTPTMGGLTFYLGVLVGVVLGYTVLALSVPSLLGGWLSGTSVSLFIGVLTAYAFGLVGFVDDYIKVVKKRNLGLMARYKIVAQVLITGAYLSSLYLNGTLSTIVTLPLLEPHLSGTVLILGIGGLMMFVGGTGLVWFGLAIAGVVAGVAGAVVLVPDLVPYAMSRIESWQNPWLDAQGDGHQIIQSMYAIGSGGLTGLGIGNSKQKHLYLPEPQNDFIFSVICEELGFIGALLVIFLFVALLLRGIYVAWHAKDKFGSMLVVGVIVQVTLQAVLNIAVVTKTIPNTGISLPFFSYGGTSLLMLLGEMGVVLSVSRQGGAEKV